MTKEAKFWCDICVSHKTGKFCAFDTKFNYERHCEQQSHIDNKLKMDNLNDEEKKQYEHCKVCDSYMTKEAFIEHKERNLKMLKMKYNLESPAFQHCSCNNFVYPYSNKRFTSYDALREYCILKPPPDYVEKLSDFFYDNIDDNIKYEDLNAKYAKIKEEQQTIQDNIEYSVGNNAFYSCNFKGHDRQDFNEEEAYQYYIDNIQEFKNNPKNKNKPFTCDKLFIKQLY